MLGLSSLYVVLRSSPSCSIITEDWISSPSGITTSAQYAIITSCGGSQQTRHWFPTITLQSVEAHTQKLKKY